ncbi:MAG: hypothetical protein A3D44_01570 [Candidatus Staskawiczbacteria bacterium RIFCSPHIGHO2_02_FULL_42_22]|uniref:Thioredoxin domain-containing protein n=1 Tax=Candidatus Staskawiczbacteria bacterium RIFCSPHIGHO2_02_FULL_42_22 TaxID=1802207 RepID=A0A1G2I1N4_9BACT|nr:MAG: hypothetical protein A3D44_01570 [Candidatus Staskawiczbacteria bacterium RIFCSPHIGHO2_02_FULL_42_22]
MKKPTSALLSWLQKNRLFFLVIAALVFLEGVLFFAYGDVPGTVASYFKTSDTSISGIILFKEAGCAPCAKVDDFIKNSNIEQIFAFTTLEISGSSKNVTILADKAQICGLNPSDVGVPFLWDGQHCVLGYVDVIHFFEEKIKSVTQKPLIDS